MISSSAKSTISRLIDSRGEKRKSSLKLDRVTMNIVTLSTKRGLRVKMMKSLSGRLHMKRSVAYMSEGVSHVGTTADNLGGRL